ncbi:MAG: YfiR family protein [bacterium]|jgi:preprotein translocase subunit SecE
MRKAALSMILLLLAAAIAAQDKAEKEKVAKAEFVLKLIENITWPAEQRVDDETVTVITVVGTSSLASYLKGAAEKLNGSTKKVEVREGGLDADLSGSHMVFIAVTELADLAAVLKKVSGQPIFTMSDNGNFAGYGVMLDFLKDDGGKVSYAVNKMALKGAGLKLSDGVLKQAKKTYG